MEQHLHPGFVQQVWTFNGTVPGPVIRVKVGDTIRVILKNPPEAQLSHSIDFHASQVAWNDEMRSIAPGEELVYEWRADYAGVWMYHCGTAPTLHHIANGMYGMVIVEPEGGLPKVDREFYVMQGDIYTKHKTGTKGHQPFDHEKLMAELPDYYVFNGAVGSLTKEHKMEAKVGETVRIYFGVGGPNKISSFHVIGEIFDRVYAEASTSAPRENVQTTTVPPGGAAIVEFKVDYPGKYVLVDHALSRAGKGLLGLLEVVGPADAAVYRDHGESPKGGMMAH